MRISGWIRIFVALLFAISFLGVPGGLAAFQSTPEATPVDTDAIRIMTYNTHHSAGNDDCEDPETPEGEIPDANCALDLDRVDDVILAEDPDIVTLQEVDRFWARSGRVAQPAEFAAILNMNSCYGANLTHDSDDHAGEHHEYGVATFSKFPIIRCENHFLPTTEGWEQRGMLDTRIDVPGVGEISVINTHLQAGVSGEPEEAARQRTEQSQAIADYISGLDVPVIVLGDLNAEVNSGEIDSLIGDDAMLTDAWAVAGDGAGETIFDGANGEPTARIDYILVSSHFEVVSTSVIDNDGSRMASDHFPLIADLTVAQQEGTPAATPVDSD